MSTIGAQPAAWAPWMRVLRAGAATRPSFSSSPNALPILVTSEPAGHRHDDVRRRAPAELLGDLVAELFEPSA